MAKKRTGSMAMARSSLAFLARRACSIRSTSAAASAFASIAAWFACNASSSWRCFLAS